MGYVNEGRAPIEHCTDLVQAFILEIGIADTQCLVYDQDIRLHINRAGKPESYRHSAAICFYRVINGVT